MPVSEKKRKSLDAYNATCDYISIRPKKDKGEQIRQAAKLARAKSARVHLAGLRRTHGARRPAHRPARRR